MLLLKTSRMQGYGPHNIFYLIPQHGFYGNTDGVEKISAGCRINQRVIATEAAILHILSLPERLGWRVYMVHCP